MPRLHGPPPNHAPATRRPRPMPGYEPVALTPVMIDQVAIVVVGRAPTMELLGVEGLVGRNEGNVLVPGLGTMRATRRTGHRERYEWPVRLRSDEMQIDVDSIAALGRMRSRVTIYSRPLWERGPVEAIERVLSAWMEFAYGETWRWHAGGVTVERLDLCADFQRLYFFAGDEDRFVTTAVVAGDFVRGDFKLGTTPISLSIYDKSKQIREKRFDDAHYRARWTGRDDGAGNVTRVEFRMHGRRALGSLAPPLYAPDALRDPAALGAAWAYLTREWARCVRPSPADANRSRHPLDPRWSIVAAVPGEHVAPARRLPKRKDDLDPAARDRSIGDRMIQAVVRVLAHDDGFAVPCDDEAAIDRALAQLRASALRRQRARAAEDGGDTLAERVAQARARLQRARDRLR